MEMPYKNGWLNGWNIDIEIYTFPGGSGVWFRIWRDNRYNAAAFVQSTLGL